MGYRPKRKLFRLDFTGTDYDGLEACMRGLTVGEELELDTLRGKPGGGHRWFEILSGLLVEWNVEDDQGNPVPTTFEGVSTQDSAMVSAVLEALQTAVSGVPAPLPQSSPSGEPSPEASIPMEARSPSPQSSAVPA